MQVNDVIPRDFSATKKLLEAGQEWTKTGGFVKSVAAHTIVPIGTIATEALDTLTHALAAVVKAVVFVPKTIVQVVTYPFGVKDICGAANLPAILEHVGKTAGNLAMIVVMPLTSLFSCSTALSVLSTLQLTEGPKEAPKGFWSNIAAQKGWGDRIKYLWSHKKDAASDTLGKIGDGAVATGKALNNKWVYAGAGAFGTLAAVEHAYNGLYKGGESYTGKGLGAAWNMLPSVSFPSLSTLTFGLLGGEKPVLPNYDQLNGELVKANEAVVNAQNAFDALADDADKTEATTALNSAKGAFNHAANALIALCTGTAKPTGCPEDWTQPALFN